MLVHPGVVRKFSLSLHPMLLNLVVCTVKFNISWSLALKKGLNVSRASVSLHPTASTFLMLNGVGIRVEIGSIL